MAQLDRDGDDLVVRLSTAEKAEAANGLRPGAHGVQGVVDDLDALHAVSAWTKTVGASIPGQLLVGTFHSDGKAFVAVHHHTPRGVRVTLEGANFDELLIGCEDPEGVIQQLGPLPPT